MTPLEILVVALGVVVIGLCVILTLTLNQIRESFRLESSSRQSQIVELHTENTRLKQRVSELEFEFSKLKEEVIKERKVELPSNPIMGALERRHSYKTRITSDGPLGFGLRERFRGRSRTSHTSSQSDTTTPSHPIPSSEMGLMGDSSMSLYLAGLAASSMLSDPVGGGCSPPSESSSYTPPSVDTYSSPSFDSHSFDCGSSSSSYDSSSSSSFDSGSSSSFDSSGGCDASW